MLDGKIHRLDDVGDNQRKTGPAGEVGDIGARAGLQIVEADNLIAVGEQALAQMRADKAGPTGDEGARRRPAAGRGADTGVDGGHANLPSASSAAGRPTQS